MTRDYWAGWLVGVAGCVAGLLAAERWLRRVDAEVGRVLS